MTPARLALAALLAALALALLGCRGLGRLPPAESFATVEPPTTPAGLWQALEKGNPIPPAQESAFASTVRVMRGDGAARKAAQHAKTACKTDPPPGFSTFVGEAIPGAAPLHAYFNRGKAERPIVFVLHGLYDSRNSRYVRQIAVFLGEQGFGVVVPDLRWHGCLLSREWLPGLGLEEARDLLAWSAFIRAREPGRPVGILGFSVGGLAVIHALAAPEATSSFSAGGIAVSPPAELARTLSAFDRGTFAADRGWLWILDQGLRRLLIERLLDQGIEPTPGREHNPFSTVLDFVLAQKFAFGGVNQTGLFLATDPAPKIQATRRPLLLLPTANDPFFGELAAAALARAAQGNAWVRVIETPCGGHLGQLGLYPSWISTLLVRFFTLAPEVTDR